MPALSYNRAIEKVVAYRALLDGDTYAREKENDRRHANDDGDDEEVAQKMALIQEGRHLCRYCQNRGHFKLAGEL